MCPGRTSGAALLRPGGAQWSGATGRDPGPDGRRRPARDRGRDARNRARRAGRAVRLPDTRCRCWAAVTGAGSSSRAARATTARTAAWRPASCGTAASASTSSTDGPAGDDVNRSAFVRSLARADLFVDAMFGTGFRGELDGDARWIAHAAGESGRATLAVDIPSGVDGATGAVAGEAVRADATVCFAALKPGLLVRARPLACRARLGGRHRHHDRAGGDRPPSSRCPS